jgi:peptide deformylase
MAVLNILEYPDPRLRKIAAPVVEVTPEIRKLVRDLADTMYAAPGVGLAATQLDVHKRVIVIDVSEARDNLQVFINPELITAEGEAESEEGCLSVPGYYDKVTRAAKIRARALNERGAAFEVEAEGLYEASVLGLCAFRKHELEPGALTQLEVEVRSSVTHTLPVIKIREWLQRGVRSPKEAVLKERLRTLLSA